MQKQKKDAEKIVESIMEAGQSFTDPLGMWTGKPADAHTLPVQDADDL